MDRVGGDPSVRVLEPSPPAITEPPWLADDPVAGGDVLPIERLGARTWSQLARERGDTALLTFCVERWLGPWRRLEAMPDDGGATRRALHAVAEHVLVPARYAATTKIGLRWTLGGFGTPFFGADRQVRVERSAIVDAGPTGERSAALTTLGDAAHFVGVAPGAPASVFTPTTPCDLEAPLAIDPYAASAIADFFGFCTSVLEQLRAESVPGDAPSRVQLWPEHFDVSVDLGDEAGGGRATFGGSPGDAEHRAPYLYVSVWTPRSGPFWNEPFGASFPYRALLDEVDQRVTALHFFRTARARLTPS
ncbi:MAG: hypothetical protein NVSMB12_12720 [Acidimicrobiales bacterium]